MKTLIALLIAGIVAIPARAKDVERTPEQVRNAENFTICGFTPDTPVTTISSSYPGVKLEKGGDNGGNGKWRSSEKFKEFYGVSVVKSPEADEVTGYLWEKDKGSEIYRKKLFEFRQKFGEPNKESDDTAHWYFRNPDLILSLVVVKSSVSISISHPK